jgi:hypothetical protein
MVKPLTFADLKRIRKMNLNDLNRWVLAIYRQANMDGRAEAMKDVAIWDPEVLEQKLKEIPQISDKRAAAIMDVILEDPDDEDQG